MGPEGTKLYAGKGLLNTDNRTVVSYQAPKDMYRHFNISYDSSMTAMGDPVSRYVTFAGISTDESIRIVEKLSTLYTKLHQNDTGRKAQ